MSPATGEKQADDTHFGEMSDRNFNSGLGLEGVSDIEATLLDGLKQQNAYASNKQDFNLQAPAGKDLGKQQNVALINGSRPEVLQLQSANSQGQKRVVSSIAGKERLEMLN